MFDLFAIFTKSGIVLFSTVHPTLKTVVNSLVKNVLLEERANTAGKHQAEQLQLQYALDNEFELVFVVGYQKLLNLRYVDKFLTDIQRLFRQKFSNFNLDVCHQMWAFLAQDEWRKRKLTGKRMWHDDESKNNHNEQKWSQIFAVEFCDELEIDAHFGIFKTFVKPFSDAYLEFVKSSHSSFKPETMRTFQDSAKSKKTIASMVVQKPSSSSSSSSNSAPAVSATVAAAPAPVASMPGPKPKASSKAASAAKAAALKSSKKQKSARMWELGGANPDEFDFSKTSSATSSNAQGDTTTKNAHAPSALLTSQDCQTNLQMTDDDESSSEDEEEMNGVENATSNNFDQNQFAEKKSYFSAFRQYVSLSKKLTKDDLKPVLNHLTEHLTRKNVAAEIAESLCESVCSKLEGQIIDSWTSLSKIAKQSLESVVLQILNPNRNINILREVQAKQNLPYIICFCGVNGVGKSTNLAKIANWLINNNVKILVIAGDTFRAGAVEQLRTHTQALKAIHERGKNAESKIELFERGYGKDAAGIAMEGIKYARAHNFGCVLIDTAGRMQDNEPLMRQLAKLISVNQPDLTLFVGEALVGNEAVDQLSKFNQALLDAGCNCGPDKSAINGIVLTKFDTIDDQVGAAISMTYVTGQPIVFVGVGQNYRDLKQLDAKAVTKALMR